MHYRTQWDSCRHYLRIYRGFTLSLLLLQVSDPPPNWPPCLSDTHISPLTSPCPLSSRCVTHPLTDPPVCFSIIYTLSLALVLSLLRWVTPLALSIYINPCLLFHHISPLTSPCPLSSRCVTHLLTDPPVCLWHSYIPSNQHCITLTASMFFRWPTPLSAFPSYIPSH